MNNNIDINNLARVNTNKNNAKERPLSNQRARKNTERNGQVETDINRVRNALRNLATKSNNNSQYDITKTQVVKYHKKALQYLLRNRSLLNEALEIDRSKDYALKFEYVSLSSNFFGSVVQKDAPAPSAPSAPPAPPAPLIHGSNLKTGLNTIFTSRQNLNKPLAGGWEHIYKLSDLVKHLKGTATFPYSTQQPDGELARKLQRYHKMTMHFSKDNFTVGINKYSNNPNTWIVIRYNWNSFITGTSQQARYIEWLYSPSPELDHAMTFIEQLPQNQRFDIDRVSIKRNEDISAKVIGMLTYGIDWQTLRTAMIAAQFPPRLFQMNNLKRKAESTSGKIKNIGTNFSNSKLSRIESFLSSVDDLFTSVASGRENPTSTEIIQIIDAFARKPHMSAVQAQGQTVNNILKPQQRREAYRQILLANTNYSIDDRRILSSPTGASLIGIVELTSGGSAIGIRKVKNDNFGTIIDTIPPLNVRTPDFQHHVRKGVITPVLPVAAGNLYSAVSNLVHFCLWTGNGLPNATHPDNLQSWWLHCHNHGHVFPPREILLYKVFTQKKLSYLISALPVHFKLKTILKEYCESHSDEPKYSWFLNLSLL